MRQLVRNLAISIGIVTTVLVIIYLFLAPPRLVIMDVETPVGTPSTLRISVDRLFGIGGNPLSIGHRFLFVINGETDVLIGSDVYETAEIEIGSRLEVMRGKVSHQSFGGFAYLVDVTLQAKVPGLQMMRYEGFLTAGGNEAPEVLAIHRKFRASHNPLDWLRRQYTNSTGLDFSTLRYVSLKLERAESGDIAAVLLDFSNANGAAVQYTPPGGWPPANLYRRILYSMDTDQPARDYQTLLPIYKNQESSPYKMGDTFFYCMIDGHYCAGRVSTFFDVGSNAQQASVEIWINEQRGNPVLRYRG